MVNDGVYHYHYGLTIPTLTIIMIRYPWLLYHWDHIVVVFTAGLVPRFHLSQIRKALAEVNLHPEPNGERESTMGERCELHQGHIANNDGKYIEK